MEDQDSSPIVPLEIPPAESPVASRPTSANVDQGKNSNVIIKKIHEDIYPHLFKIKQSSKS